MDQNREKELAQAAKDINLGPKMAREMRKFEEQQSQVIEQGMLRTVMENEINENLQKGDVIQPTEEIANKFAELIEELGAGLENDS